uniref:Uncharacterized protein n=1 Tax=viral metagenome TaxID=1070528 RepID=A0A6M3J930_9ZZZZ
MNLLEVRTKLVELSGRYDLVTDVTSYADNGADFFIKAGQDYLDRSGTFSKSVSKVYNDIAASAFYTLMQRARAVQEVWVSNAEGKYKLEKRDLAAIKAYYSDPIADIDTGRPLFYSPAAIRTVPRTDDEITIDSFYGTAYTYAADDFSYDAIVHYPPADEAYQIEVWGLFYSAELTLDASESWWTIKHPATLIKAALREIEVFYRNTEGVKDWGLAVGEDTVGIDKDLVEQDISEINQMEG